MYVVLMTIAGDTLMTKIKQPKYKPGTLYKITVIFERDGSDVEALMAKLKTHKYCWIEEKWIEKESQTP